ncbi:K(+)-transporting ATPase subunit C [Sphingobacterium oryzagri]|uniref:Potassium-transporting ATPase KdpC subunit n=1 Tax=Sphingobacterium oryzagri TaxID=3025669 RepID=A0ABY7WPP9_9SPHI|nr:K(+)-transporting ATPase subunit C [Sphingobacterium sp. KACC 22765]WDF70391.1 K(+)-transporting ATPase subunit C [Sphingobacterium sp. KACC 22765]
MKTHLFPAIKLTILLIVLLTVIYPAVVWGIAQLSSAAGEGQTLTAQGKTYYRNIGQSFTQDKYFWSRPSAVGYNAAGSAGSNKGPSNQEYLATVQMRIDTLLAHNPGITVSQIPMDLVTASGSGLDPDFSVQAAKVQVARIAKIRNIPEAKLISLINMHTERPLLGLFGPERINVLALNSALDKLSSN